MEFFFFLNHLVKVFPIWLNLGVKMYMKHNLQFSL